MQVIADVRLFRNSFTICLLSNEQCTLPSEQHYTLIGVKKGDVSDPEILDMIEQIPMIRRLKFRINAYFLQPFVSECLVSNIYRNHVVTYLNKLTGTPDKGIVFLKLILEPPDLEIIDYAWNERLLKLIWTRVEVENAFSWLSTLGGAYSALGDYFEHCAEEAGRISIRQYKLSRMLGDDSLAARSILYSALSYSQKGNLRASRRIVRRVAVYAIETHDKRLLRMCQGIWAKLKYLRELSKKGNEFDTGNGKFVIVNN